MILLWLLSQGMGGKMLKDGVRGKISALYSVFYLMGLAGGSGAFGPLPPR